MMPLGRIEPVARPLLRRVDAALEMLGAPADHPVWPALRRVRATTADTVALFARVRPERIRAMATPVRREIETYRFAAVPAEIAWEGGVAELYGYRAAGLNRHLCGGGPDSLTERLDATACFAEELADWYVRAQRAMAATLAEVISSAHAVTLASGSIGPTDAAAGSAAADIGARVLQTAAEALDQGHDVERRWSQLVDETTLTPVDDAGPVRFDAGLRVDR